MLAQSQMLFHPHLAPRGIGTQQNTIPGKFNPFIMAPFSTIPNIAPQIKPQYQPMKQYYQHPVAGVIHEDLHKHHNYPKDQGIVMNPHNNQVYLESFHKTNTPKEAGSKKEKKALNKFDKLFHSTILNVSSLENSDKKANFPLTEAKKENSNISMLNSQLLTKFEVEESVGAKIGDDFHGFHLLENTDNTNIDPKWKEILRQNETLNAFDEKIREIIERTRENHNRILKLKNSSNKSSEPGSLDINKGKYLEGSTTASIEEDVSKSSEKENLVNFTGFDDQNIMYKSCDGNFFLNEVQISPRFNNVGQKFKKTSKSEKKSKIDELLERIDVLKSRYICEDLKMSPKALTSTTVTSVSSPKKNLDDALEDSTLTIPMDYSSRLEVLSKEKVECKFERALNKCNRNWKISDFQIGRCLGKGRFGAVHLAKDRVTNFTVAIKIVERSEEEGERLVDQIKNEVKLQSYLDHPNIIKMYGWFSDERNMYLILEYAPGGDLYNLMNCQPTRRFDERTVAIFIKQVSESIKFLHKHSIIHRDLKPENIMISNGVLKLSDFGWAIYAPKERRKTFCGTLDYVSPEVVEGQSYDDKIDIWSIGVLCYELSVGKAPFEQPSENETFHQIVNVRYQIPYWFSYELRDFLNSILVREPKYRLDIDGILNHPWIIYNTRG